MTMKSNLIPTDDLSKATVCYMVNNPYPSQSLVNNTYYPVYHENNETYVYDENGRRNFGFCQFGYQIKLYIESK